MCLLCYPPRIFVAEAITSSPYEYTPMEGSIEELYKDIIVTLIQPYISNEVKIHYGKLLQYDLFDIKFLKIERPSFRSFDFTIKLQIRPFVGAHNTIGIDNITIRISPIKFKLKNLSILRVFQFHLVDVKQNLISTLCLQLTKPII